MSAPVDYTFVDRDGDELHAEEDNGRLYFGTGNDTGDKIFVLMTVPDVVRLRDQLNRFISRQDRGES